MSKENSDVPLKKIVAKRWSNLETTLPPTVHTRAMGSDQKKPKSPFDDMWEGAFAVAKKDYDRNRGRWIVAPFGEQTEALKINEVIVKKIERKDRPPRQPFKKDIGMRSFVPLFKRSECSMH